MLINFPNQLTSEEEQLLKKIAKMKKKKKIYIEKKAQLKESQNEIIQHTTSSSTTQNTSLKRPASSKAKQIDAKEAAKKLIQSGVIKLETDNKVKGFKRSSSRKDDIKKPIANPTIQNSPYESNQQITYSSIQNSPNFTKSPNAFPSPNYAGNKFNYPTSGDGPYGQSPNYNNQRQFQRRMHQSPNSTGGGDVGSGGGGAGSGPMPGAGMPNFRYHQKNHYNNHQQNGISLFIKANNVTEELLRSLFNANVSQVKVLSIDVKNNYAFVSVENKEGADIAIQELNGKTFQENLFSVSIARPRKNFQRNNSYNQNNNYNGNNKNNHNNNYPPPQNRNYAQNNYNNYQNNNNNINYSNDQNNGNNSNNPNVPQNPTDSVNSGQNIPSNPTETANSNRQMINYEDI